MTNTRPRVLAVSALIAVAAAAGCGARAEAPVASVSGAAEPGTVTSEQTVARDLHSTRTDDERQYLAELGGFGLPTEMTAVTTIEVGAGICRGIADGADDETILERIRPLTSAIAAQNAELDTAEVGRAIVEASRTHLCP